MSDARGNSDRPSQLSSNPLANYEAAEDAILARGASPELHKAAVLALARSGATEFALERFNAFGLCALDSDEDALALLGRLHKDRADTLNGLPRRMALQESAGAYLRAYRLTGGIYSGINAATMSVIAGNRSAAEAIARNVFKKAHQPVAGESVEMRYYREATCTEALIITGRADDAVRALAETISVDPDNYIAHATTLRQFERLLRAMDEPLDWLDAFPGASMELTVRVSILMSSDFRSISIWTIAASGQPMALWPRAAI